LVSIIQFINLFNLYLFQVMQEYFKEVEEESIRDNFVICYELLDELVDFGYPQTTDAKILQEYITQVTIKLIILLDVIIIIILISIE